MRKTAIVTGITGQDGSYLADLLLEKDYKVYGLKRRTSKNDLGSASHLEHHKNLEVIEGDLLDFPSIQKLCKLARADEFYNLAAQSHVGSSFEQPSYTLEASGMGVLNCLEAIRESGIHTRFYQASTSELYGGQNGESFASETTKFHPRSPYGCAKLYGYWITVNYREAYKMFTCNGILFNHETVIYGTPMIMKDSNNQIDILPIGDIARFHSGVSFDMNNAIYQEGKPSNKFQVWDQNGWVDVTWVSGYPSSLRSKEDIKIVNARNYTFIATDNHVAILEDGSEKETSSLSVGDRIKNIEYPEPLEASDISLEEAEFLGMLVGDGNLSKNNPRFTNKDQALKNRFVELWKHFTGLQEYKTINSKSGFTGEDVGQIICINSKKRIFDIYCNDISPFGHKLKKVPKVILNSNPEVMEAFLIGYNNCDGLKANNCTYRFKNFKTNSATLAAGLLYLINHVTKQEYNITVEESNSHGKIQYYYSVNLLSPTDNFAKESIVKALLNQNYSQRAIARETGISRGFIRKIATNGHAKKHHLKKVGNEIKKILPFQQSVWMFDLETSSGTFHAGIGNGVIHNSPRRGPNFVTRKITLGIANIKAGKQDKIYLGNLDAKRDWGHAKDYIEGIWLMMNHQHSDDFVLATGETHSVRDFCKIAFDFAGLGDYQNYVEVDPRFYRPAEVDVLLGDATKARRELGWKPRYSFKDLVEEMVQSDLIELGVNHDKVKGCVG